MNVRGTFRSARTGERTPLGVRSAQARSEATETVEVGESNPAWRATKKDTRWAGSHKDVYKTVGTGVLDCPQQKNFGRVIVFSADLCYTKSLPPRGRWHSVAVTEGACVTLDLD